MTDEQASRLTGQSSRLIGCSGSFFFWVLIPVVRVEFDFFSLWGGVVRIDEVCVRLE